MDPGRPRNLAAFSRTAGRAAFDGQTVSMPLVLAVGRRVGLVGLLAARVRRLERLEKHVEHGDVVDLVGRVDTIARDAGLLLGFAQVVRVVDIVPGAVQMLEEMNKRVFVNNAFSRFLYTSYFL